MNKPPASFRPENSFYGFTVKRPVAILMVVMAVVVFGYVSYNRLSLTLMPDMSYPTLTVRTVYAGTAPEEIENIVSRPLEQALGIIPNLVAISSISKAGQSDVILEFQWKTDMTAVAQEVREKIDRIRFPEGSERPLLLHYDPSLDPIMRLGLTGPQSLYDLRFLAENDIKRKLETIPGVAAIKVKGGLEEEFLVALDESRLASLRLDITQIGQRLQQGNVNMPGGNLREGQTEYLIRTLNEFRTVEEIGELIVSRQGNVDVRLRDIATVTRFHKDREVITRVNGRESIEIEIFKEADANVVSIAATLRDAIFGTAAQQAYLADLQKPEEPASTKAGARAREARRQDAAAAVVHRQMTDFMTQQLPPDTELQLLSDQSVFISKSIEEVKSNAVSGAIIAIVVIYLFLRHIGQTIIISLAIPVSIVATFAPMYMSGATLNIISLGGLALGVGMLVDNGIVVLESIYRCREEGDALLTAVVRGTDEVGMAVVASTLTTVAVFLPIVFVEGVAGQVFGDMALTVVFSLLASLVTALFLIPMLASRRFGNDDSNAARVSSSTFLRFDTAASAGAGQRVGKYLSLLVLRPTLALGLILAVTLKFSLVLLFVALWPLILLASRLVQRGVSGNRSWSAACVAWAGRDAFWKLEGRAVWPGLLSFAAPSTLATSLAALWSWCVQPPRWRTVLRLIPALVATVFLLARCLAEIGLRLVSSVLQATVLALAQLFLAVGHLLKELVGPAVGVVLDGFERGFRGLQMVYEPILRGALRQRAAVLGSSVLLLAGCIYFLVPRIGKELIPQVRQGEFNFEITLPIGTPLERTGEIAAQIDAAVQAQPEVERTSLTVGAEPGASTTRESGEHTAQLVVKLKPDGGPEAETLVVDRIRQQFSDQPELELELSYPALFSFKSPVEVEIRGHDLEGLKQMSREAEAAMARVPGVVDVRSTLQTGHPEIQVIYNRDRLSEYGLNLRTVADLVRSKVQGRIATEFRREDQMIDIVVRLREEDRFGIEELRRLIINPNGTVPIPLSAIADLTITEGPSEIRRVNQQRTALITANLRETDLATASAGIVAELQELNFPPGFSYNLAGQNSEMKTSLDSLLLAFALALFLVYIVMASQFESLVQPFLIMMTVPLALIGVIVVLWLTGIPISIMVLLGLIILAGIVVNNAIVLIDYINTLRDRGLDMTTAIIDAGRARIRPIFMTTLTTVLGLVPMALGLGEGAEIRAPMAITVIVGLTSSTLLTLVVIPLLYFQFAGRRPQAVPTTANLQEPAMAGAGK